MSYCVVLCGILCLFVCICVYLCVFVCIVCVCVYMCVFARPKLRYSSASRMSYLLRCVFWGVQNGGVCIWGCVYMCVYVCICVYMCVYVCEYVRICVYLCVNVCEYVWILWFSMNFYRMYEFSMNPTVWSYWYFVLWIFFVFWIFFDFPLYVRLFFDLNLIFFDFFYEWMNFSMIFSIEWMNEWFELILKSWKWVKIRVFSSGVKMLENRWKSGFLGPPGFDEFHWFFYRLRFL